jgi:hypothetical protein
MSATGHFAGVTVGALLAVVALISVPKPAEALTAELAKKCRSMAMKTIPSARPGTKTGAQKAQTEYYRECVAKNGNMDDYKPKTDDKAK